MSAIFSVDEVSALRQQLRSSQRSLKKSEKANRQLMREMKKLEERIESMAKLQKLIAERQIKEVSDGDGTASLVTSTQRQQHGRATADTTSDTQASTFVAEQRYRV